MIRVVTIIGARPQFIKAAAVSRAIALHNRTGGPLLVETIIHTGQHYDHNMSAVFFDELKIPLPTHNLEIGSDSHAGQTGRMLQGIERLLLEQRPDVVLTYGDTNSTLAGALAAAKLQIPSAHVEAGLRSFNRSMPEEINRVAADAVCSILFCPTRTSVENLKKEGVRPCTASDLSSCDIDSRLFFQVGDVMYDALRFYENLAEDKSKILSALGLCTNRTSGSGLLPGAARKTSPYLLATVHRAENTDNRENLLNIFEVLSNLPLIGHRVVLPLHPRTRNRLGALASGKSWDLIASGLVRGSPGSAEAGPREGGLHIVDPVGYLDMIMLEKHATAILTDSGGMQKEAFLLRRPCITLRKETEWTETLQAGWNVLVGADPGKIRRALSAVSNHQAPSPPFLRAAGESAENEPYGDGDAAGKIVDILVRILGRHQPVSVK